MLVLTPLPCSLGIIFWSHLALISLFLFDLHCLGPGLSLASSYSPSLRHWGRVMSNFQLPRNHLQNAEEEGHIFYLSYHALILSFLQHQKASSILRACTFPVFPIIQQGNWDFPCFLCRYGVQITSKGTEFLGAGCLFQNWPHWYSSSYILAELANQER